MVNGKYQIANVGSNGIHTRYYINFLARIKRASPQFITVDNGKIKKIMAYLPFRAIVIFFGSFIVGALVAWRINIWIGLLTILLGVISAVYLAIRDTIKELKGMLSIAGNPKKALADSGMLGKKLPFWLKPVAYVIFNKILDKKFKNTQNKPPRKQV